MLLEDLFVIDAPTLWRQRARGGELVALHPLDGATIKRVIDDWGARHNLSSTMARSSIRRLSANTERLSGGRLRRARHHLRAAQSARQSRLWIQPGRADRDDANIG